MSEKGFCRLQSRYQIYFLFPHLKDVQTNIIEVLEINLRYHPISSLSLYLTKRSFKYILMMINEFVANFPLLLLCYINVISLLSVISLQYPVNESTSFLYLFFLVKCNWNLYFSNQTNPSVLWVAMTLEIHKLNLIKLHFEIFLGYEVI